MKVKVRIVLPVIIIRVVSLGKRNQININSFADMSLRGNGTVIYLLQDVQEHI